MKYISSRRGPAEAGFALIETVLVLVILSAIVGVGLYVVQQRQAASDTLTNSSSSTGAAKAQGTSSSIDQLTEQDAQNETKADQSADSATKQNAGSADSAVDSVGGAYNEASL